MFVFSFCYPYIFYWQFLLTLLYLCSIVLILKTLEICLPVLILIILILCLLVCLRKRFNYVVKTSNFERHFWWGNQKWCSRKSNYKSFQPLFCLKDETFSQYSFVEMDWAQAWRARTQMSFLHIGWDRLSINFCLKILRKTSRHCAGP